MFFWRKKPIDNHSIRGWIPKPAAPFAKSLPTSAVRPPRRWPESEAHKRCKLAIYEALLREPGVKNVRLERPLGTNRPDVSAYINDVPVAIEVQISDLSEETIVHRTIEYARKGIYVLWLAQWTRALDAKRYSPALWEKWVHATYFGQVYYWIEGLTVASYRFERSYRTIPRNTWYSKNGKKVTAGGYSRRSKRYRSAIRGETLNLATDFIPKKRDWWEESKLTIPFAKLYMHREKSNSQPALRPNGRA